MEHRAYDGVVKDKKEKAASHIKFICELDVQRYNKKYLHIVVNDLLREEGGPYTGMRESFLRLYPDIDYEEITNIVHSEIPEKEKKLQIISIISQSLNDFWGKRVMQLHEIKEVIARVAQEKNDVIQHVLIRIQKFYRQDFIEKNFNINILPNPTDKEIHAEPAYIKGYSDVCIGDLQRPCVDEDGVGIITDVIHEMSHQQLQGSATYFDSMCGEFTKQHSHLIENVKQALCTEEYLEIIKELVTSYIDGYVREELGYPMKKDNSNMTIFNFNMHVETSLIRKYIDNNMCIDENFLLLLCQKIIDLSKNDKI